MKILKNLNLFFLYSSVFLIPFYFFRFGFAGIRTNIFEVFVVVSFLLTLIQILFKNKLISKISLSEYLLPVLFLICALVGYYVAGENIKALGIFKGWFLIPVLLAWSIALNFDTNSIKKISIPLFISLMIVSLWAILQRTDFIGALFYQTQDGNFIKYLSENPKRVLGPFESPNFLAMYLVPTLFLSSAMLELIERKSDKVIICILYLLPVIALFFSGSKGGFLALAISFLVYLNYRFINTVKSSQGSYFFKIFSILLYVVINTIYLIAALKYFVPITGSDSTRQEIYKYAIMMTKDNPILGIGLGSFQDKIALISQSNTSFRLFALPYALHPHNLLMAMWLNLSISGLVIFLAVVVKFLINSFKTDLLLRAVLLATMTAILVHGFFDTTYFKNDLSATFWVIYAIALIRKNKDEEKL